MMNDDLAKAQIGGTLSIEWTTSGTLTDSLRHIALIANGMGRAAAGVCWRLDCLHFSNLQNRHNFATKTTRRHLPTQTKDRVIIFAVTRQEERIGYCTESISDKGNPLS
jgi:hypothetical protein